MVCGMEDMELTSWPDLMVSFALCIRNHLVTCTMDDAGRTCVLTCCLIDREAEGCPYILTAELEVTEKRNQFRWIKRIVTRTHPESGLS